MLGQKKTEELLTRALHFSKAGSTEVILTTDNAYLTRFANNIVHQNVAESNATITVRAVDGKRAGSASTNDLGDDALQQTVERALEHAQQQPEDPNFPGLAEPKPIELVQSLDQDTVNFSPDARAEDVGTVCAAAAAQKLNAYGAFSTRVNEIAIANSNGVLAYHALSSADFQATIMGDNGSGRARASSWKVGEINAKAVGREAIDKALRAQNPREIEPGAYTVVVDPYVTLDLILMLNMVGVSAEAVQEGRSWMNDRIGSQVMSPEVSIWDDGLDPNGLPLPFDFEGVPRQRVDIIDKGVVRGPVFDRYTAAKEDRESTGHATPPDAMFMTGPLALNLFMAEGDQSVEDMIKSTGKGLFITRFWYTRVVHPRDCIITGMTRDGLFMIEDGELTFPVKNLRFTQSYVDALAAVQAVGDSAKTLASEFGLGAARVPALKIKSFNFTGSTV